MKREELLRNGYIVPVRGVHDCEKVLSSMFSSEQVMRMTDMAYDMGIVIRFVSVTDNVTFYPGREEWNETEDGYTAEGYVYSLEDEQCSEAGTVVIERKR